MLLLWLYLRLHSAGFRTGKRGGGGGGSACLYTSKSFAAPPPPCKIQLILFALRFKHFHKQNNSIPRLVIYLFTAK
jgi:hypothetical protein